MKKFIRSSVGFTLLLLLGFTLLRSFGIGPASVSLNFEDDCFVLEGPEDCRAVVYYSSIEQMVMEDVGDIGTALNGGEKNGLVYGRWENDRWGNYSAFLDTGMEKCILIRTDGELIVFNYESRETTEQLFEVFPSLLEEKGLKPLNMNATERENG